ncbi:MAG: alanine racemase, partial [Verrucomicrobiota bacterium]
MSSHSQLPLRCWAEIDLAALERNLGSIKAALPQRIKYIAVVKADAYGHGMQQTVARLMHAGIDMFAVANISEAATIREIGSGWPILILGATLADEAPFLFEYDLIPTISTIDEIGRLESLAAERNQSLKVHLKVDTGMGRLGIWHEYAQELFEAVKAANHLQIDGIYTHFASANQDLEYTRLQRTRFMDTLKSQTWLQNEELLIHADNSAGINSFSPDSSYNAVRVGLFQFGISPYPRSIFAGVPIDPIFSFKTRVGIVKELPAGADVSYGRTKTLSKDSRISIICAGYGDGLPLTVSNRGEVLINGQRCPILGRVTMDQAIVDISHVRGEVNSGDEVVLIGAQGEAEI